MVFVSFSFVLSVVVWLFSLTHPSTIHVLTSNQHGDEADDHTDARSRLLLHSNACNGGNKPNKEEEQTKRVLNTVFLEGSESKV